MNSICNYTFSTTVYNIIAFYGKNINFIGITRNAQKYVKIVKI